MKKILFMLLAIATIAGCDKGGDDSPISGYDRKQLAQILYADQTEGNFTFTASESWTTQVRDVTRSTDAWIRLDPAQGGPGTVTLKITLSPNLTGADRKAEITIACGEATITVTVEQKATSGGGNEPSPEVPAKARVISRMDSFEDGSPSGYITFDYDAQGRTKRCCIYDEGDVLTYKADMTYTTGQIRMETYSKDGSYTNNETILFALDANGRATSKEEVVEGKTFKSAYTYDPDGYLTDYPSGAIITAEVNPGPVTGKTASGAAKIVMSRIVWAGENMKTQYEEWQDGEYDSKTEYAYTDYKNGFATIDLMMGGSMTELLILNNGVFGKSSRNLIARETVTRKASIGTDVHTWSYKFDAEGYVTEFTRAFTSTGPESDYTESYKITYK